MKWTNLSAMLLALPAISFVASAQRPAYDPKAPTGVDLPPQTIVVDGDCKVLQNPGAPAEVKPRWKKDEILCHLETVLNSDHPEERISGGMAQKSWVHVAEQTYVMQNVADGPVVFEVRNYVPQGWQVDSDPQPVETVPLTGKKGGWAAIFRVNAQPGEIVRLHTGMRHTEVGKAKPVKVAVPGLSAPAGN